MNGLRLHTCMALLLLIYRKRLCIMPIIWGRPIRVYLSIKYRRFFNVNGRRFGIYIVNGQSSLQFIFGTRGKFCASEYEGKQTKNPWNILDFLWNRIPSSPPKKQPKMILIGAEIWSSFLIFVMLWLPGLQQKLLFWFWQVFQSLMRISTPSFDSFLFNFIGPQYLNWGRSSLQPL